MITDTRHADALQFIQRALPLDSVSALLQALSDAWNEATEATSGWFISLLHSELLEGLRFQDGQSHRISNESGTTEWTVTAAIEALAGECDSATVETMTVVPFEFEDRLVGGILLFGAADATGSEQLADVSARLVEQLNRLCSVETAEPPALEAVNPIPAQYERRLRDLKLEAMAEFSAGAGHEINNPVATIVGRSSLLLKDEPNPDRRRALETIGGQALRIRDMIGDAMTFARPPEPQCVPMVAAEHVLSVLESLQERFTRQATKVDCELDESIQINADPEQFRVVVSCLLRNSLEASGEGGQVSLGLLNCTDEPGMARLTVRDDGPGLTEIEAEHLFDPFFSGRQAGRGLGFGLARCWQILRQHGGWIDAVSCCDKTGFTIHSTWPLAQETD